MSGDPLIPADKRRMLDEENIAMTMAYNFMSAFVACLVIILLGEWLAKLTKGWIPSVFISAVIILKTVESTLSQIRRRRARGTSGLWPSSP